MWGEKAKTRKKCFLKGLFKLAQILWYVCSREEDFKLGLTSKSVQLLF